MKRSILFGKYIVAMAFVAVIFQTGCKREAGYYSSTPVVSTTNLNTYEYLKSKPGVYDSLLLLVDKMKIAKTLTDSTVTLFAPSNASFQIAVKNLNAVRAGLGQVPIYLTQLAAGDKPVTDAKLKPKAKRDSINLDTLVSKYIIRTKYLSNDFTVGDGQYIKSVRGGYPMHAQRVFADAEGFQNGGSDIIEFANTKRSLFVVKWSKTTTTSVNIKTKNGIVHLLRPDHVFGFDELVARLTLVPPPTNLFNVKIDKFAVSWPAASGYFDGQVSSGEVLAKVLDGSVLTKFISNFSQGSAYYPTLSWFPRDPNGSGKFIGAISNSYTMTTANDSKLYKDRNPRDFKVEGTLGVVDPITGNVDPTNPASVWVLLDVRQDQDWNTNYQQKIFDFVNTTRYYGYRITITRNGTGKELGGLFQISEWTMNYREQL
jgi:hypothetical protein